MNRMLKETRCDGHTAIDKTSRRGFLAQLTGATTLIAGAALAGAAPAKSQNAAWSGAPNGSQAAVSFPALPVHRGRKSVLDNLHLESFAPHVQTRFGVRGEASETGEIALELVKAKAGRFHDPARGNEQFSLTFRGPQESPIGQGNYTFSHSHLGTFELFIVPIGCDEQGRYYEAVFNRIPRA